jgi:dienelactone hydrolase
MRRTVTRLLLALFGSAFLALAAGATAGARAHAAGAVGGTTAPSPAAPSPLAPAPPVPPVPPSPPPPAVTAPAPLFAVGIHVVRLTDPSRSVRLPSGKLLPRTLLTYVRYPARGTPGEMDQRDAPAVRSGGPLPMIVFAHGFAVNPATYTRLLQSWAAAGFVVAAPQFLLESSGAPDGPTESDLGNEPSDMSFVITQMLAAAAPVPPLQGLLDPTRIAVAGHSDGAIAALAAVYSTRFRDPRVAAAVIMSGATLDWFGHYFPIGSAPLLAIQGTADTVNPRSVTERYFKRARRPKFLLRLLGAGHLVPYTTDLPHLASVERESIAFLNTYLRRGNTLAGMLELGTVPSISSLLAEP